MNYKIRSALLKVEKCRLFHTSRGLRETHYETLNLPKDCTTKQIRDSFIKLSKEHHPDRNKCENAHAEFVKIQEAYNVLSKPQSRRNYDLCMSNPYSQNRSNPYQNGYYYQDIYYSRPDPYGRYSHRRKYNPWDDPSFWANRKRAEDEWYRRKPYYGVHGIDKVSNISIAFVCILLAFIGISLQVIAIRSSFTLRRDEMRRRSEGYQMDLEELRKRVHKNGNDVQLALLKQRLLPDNDDDN